MFDVARLLQRPVDCPVVYGRVMEDAYEEIDKLRRGLFHALIQAGYKPDDMEPEIATYNKGAAQSAE